MGVLKFSPVEKSTKQKPDLLETGKGLQTAKLCFQRNMWFKPLISNHEFRASTLLLSSKDWDAGHWLRDTLAEVVHVMHVLQSLQQSNGTF